jgi:hypothetical protein
MAPVMYFLVWPAIAGVAVFLNCWRWNGMQLGTSILIGLGIAAGVLAFGLAMVGL